MNNPPPAAASLPCHHEFHGAPLWVLLPPRHWQRRREAETYGRPAALPKPAGTACYSRLARPAPAPALALPTSAPHQLNQLQAGLVPAAMQSALQASALSAARCCSRYLQGEPFGTAGLSWLCSALRSGALRAKGVPKQSEAGGSALQQAWRVPPVEAHPLVSHRCGASTVVVLLLPPLPPRTK